MKLCTAIARSRELLRMFSVQYNKVVGKNDKIKVEFLYFQHSSNSLSSVIKLGGKKHHNKL